MKPAAKMRIDVWSDIACPWCYVGKRRLEAALGRFSRRDATEVVWRAFELDPAAPRERDRSRPYAERLAQKYRSSVEQAAAMIKRMTDLASLDGLRFDFERIRPGNTFDAHRLIHLAGERGVQDAVKERLLRAYMTEGEAIGDPETLVRLASEAGLDGQEARAVLAGDRYTAEVRADEAEAQEIGVSGVPFFVIGGRYALSGAQSADVILGALDRAWSELEARPVMVEEQEQEQGQEQDQEEESQGATCGPDGCG
jgi:predicted DsbA family dithiol-disulfide isomerase